MNKIWFSLVVLLCFATTYKLRADQAADEATIRNNVAAYVAAYNNHDAKTLATFWSPDAVYVNPETGDEAVGHDAIADQFAANPGEPRGRKIGGRCEIDRVPIADGGDGTWNCASRQQVRKRTERD